MPSTDPIPPAFYILFGAFIVLVAFYMWRSLRQRFSGSDRRSHATKSFSVHLIDDGQSPSSNRQWRWDTLTPREMEVAQLAAQGKRNSEIARDLHISIRTVETHLANIYDKLNVRSRAELGHLIRDLVD